MNDYCTCDLRTRLVGDGCQWCRPDLAARYEAEREEEDESPRYVLTPLGEKWRKEGK